MTSTCKAVMDRRYHSTVLQALSSLANQAPLTIHQFGQPRVCVVYVVKFHSPNLFVVIFFLILTFYRNACTIPRATWLVGLWVGRVTWLCSNVQDS